jgi:hypothetical protein
VPAVRGRLAARVAGHFTQSTTARYRIGRGVRRMLPNDVVDGKDGPAAPLRAPCAHDPWSDGVLTVPELVDLYGRAGLDVLAVTDHVLREPAPGCRLLGAHPYPLETARMSPRGTARLATDPAWAREAVHRLELVNRHDFFHWSPATCFRLWRTVTSTARSISGPGRPSSAAGRRRKPCSSSCGRRLRSS